MVIRFWGREDLAQQPREKISEWLDTWHADNHAKPEAIRRLCAWELFKLDNPQFDSGGDGNPADIPIGLGFQYLNKVATLEQKHGIDAIENLRSGEHPDGPQHIREKLIGIISAHATPTLTPKPPTPPASTPPPATAPSTKTDPLTQGCLVIVILFIVAIAIAVSCTKETPEPISPEQQAQIAKHGEMDAYLAEVLVKRYLKNSAKDPDSVKIYGMTELYRTPKGWAIGADWGARNSFGGMVRSSTIFTLSKKQVIDATSIEGK